jgi:prepilin peptidase CpaA
MFDFFTGQNTVLLAAASALTVAAVTDMKSLRIPNECSLLLLVLYPIHVWTSNDVINLWTSVAVFLGVFGAAFAVHYFGRFGGGDVKLLSVMALWAGTAHIAEFLILTSLIGGVMALGYLTQLKWMMVDALRLVGQSDVAEHVLHDRLPYGIAIASGGLVLLLNLAA